MQQRDRFSKGGINFPPLLKAYLEGQNLRTWKNVASSTSSSSNLLKFSSGGFRPCSTSGPCALWRCKAREQTTSENVDKHIIKSEFIYFVIILQIANDEYSPH